MILLILFILILTWKGVHYAMGNFDLFIRKITAIFLTLISMLILAINLSKSNLEYYCKRNFLLNNISLIFMGIIILFLLTFIYVKNKDKLDRLLNRTTKRTFVILAVIFFFIQVFLCVNIFFTTGWDVGILISNAQNIASGDIQNLNNAYFSKYNNNLFLVGIFSLIFRTANFIGITSSPVQLMIIVTLQCILSSICGYLILVTTKDITSSYKYAYISWILYVILLGTSPWLVIPYSDSMALILPIAIFRLFYLIKNNKHIYWKWFGISLLSYLGFRIKPQAFIIFIAIVIVGFIHILTNIKAVDFKKLFKAGSVILITFIISSKLTGIFINSLGFNLDKNKQFGLTHFAMMGLNPGTDGVWDENDVNYSDSFKDTESRKKANINEIKKRLSNYGFNGFINHSIKKSLINFNDGTFCFAGEGTFYVNMSKDKIKIISPFLKETLLSSGKYYKYSAVFRHGTWILLLLMILGISISNLKIISANLDISVLCLSLIGIIIFEMIFEPRARYLYIYVPLYIICGTIGLHNFYNLIFSKHKGVK